MEESDLHLHLSREASDPAAHQDETSFIVSQYRRMRRRRRRRRRFSLQRPWRRGRSSDLTGARPRLPGGPGARRSFFRTAGGAPAAAAVVGAIEQACAPAGSKTTVASRPAEWRWEPVV